MSKLNPYELKRLVHSFGVRNREIVPSVSLCLGPCEVSVGEMVSAYTAFPNKGIRVAPLFVTRIEDNDGNVLATFSPEMQEVISASSAYKMLVMLRAVVNEGTGGRVRRLGVKAIWVVRPVRPTIMPTAGSWALRLRWCPAAGWAVKTVIFTSIRCCTDKALPWHCYLG